MKRKTRHWKPARPPYRSLWPAPPSSGCMDRCTVFCKPLLAMKSCIVYRVHSKVNVKKKWGRYVDFKSLKIGQTVSDNKNSNFFFRGCAAGFALLNLPKGKSLGRSKPATSSYAQALATHCVGIPTISKLC